MTISYVLYASANAIGQIAGAQILYSVGATGLSVCIILMHPYGFYILIALSTICR